ncbi:lipocalin-like domain-containing protein [Lactiplantibacillus daowaiensis]|uniref:Lipocalin-like domain-containing protein n=1 Tax=Lactiplantibacillus daowaiensis TaxID=2559918 RepID=A0ABW1RX62_9LACO|nr:lipocalin-like domain-containing protein [Lactiplantibacillus daowaiensis]
MAQSRLMAGLEDYQRLGLKSGEVELWEDGKRDDDRRGVVEWWYFDVILDDGSKIAAVYSTKIQPFMFMKGTHPCIKFDLTTPDGRQISKRITKFPNNEISFSEEKCDVRWGDNYFEGDLKTYNIKVAPVDGFGFDVQLKSESSPWRGETGHIGFEANDEKYFTWLCVVPRGKVTGTVMIDGQVHEVTGVGYHDHQWGNTTQFDFLNHWFWSRQSTSKHTLTVFDFVMNEHYEYKRIPLVFLQDINGKLLFDSTDNVECEVHEEFMQKESVHEFPKVTHYLFRSGEKTIEYTVKVKQELDARYIYKMTPFFLRWIFKGTKPKYGRYLAEGTINYIDGDRSFIETSDLIYEFAYVGENYREHMTKPLVKGK